MDEISSSTLLCASTFDLITDWISSSLSSRHRPSVGLRVAGQLSIGKKGKGVQLDAHELNADHDVAQQVAVTGKPDYTFVCAESDDDYKSAEFGNRAATFIVEMKSLDELKSDSFWHKASAQTLLELYAVRATTNAQGVSTSIVGLTSDGVQFCFYRLPSNVQQLIDRTVRLVWQDGEQYRYNDRNPDAW